LVLPDMLPMNENLQEIIQVNSIPVIVYLSKVMKRDTILVHIT
jgi:hypothetical protein